LYKIEAVTGIRFALVPLAPDVRAAVSTVGQSTTNGKPAYSRANSVFLRCGALLASEFLFRAGEIISIDVPRLRRSKPAGETFQVHAVFVHEDETASRIVV
jgi:hypothetical protein